MFGPTVLRIKAISSAVAPPVENPVDVLTKSVPAFTAISHARTFSSSVNRQVSIITFTNAFPLAASTTARISRSTSSSSLSFSAPILITISTSFAPFWIASFTSNAFTSGVFAPSGKPITVHTTDSAPASCSADSFTQVGFTHTEAKPYSLASFVSVKICSFVVSGFKAV
ncbi:deoxyribose-phosphate aldolase [Listeria monocytogenes]|nr:deoxyribose-phosphate aldolase [Listeria monocytogenes]